MQKKIISPAAIIALREALVNIYWYKKDLRFFLEGILENQSLISRWNWNDDYKRTIIDNLINLLTKRQKDFQQELINLMLEVSKIDDFSHLMNLEDGKIKARKAKESVAALKKFTLVHEDILENKKKAEERRKNAQEQIAKQALFSEKLNDLKSAFYSLLSIDNSQKKGFALEKLLKEIFELFDLDPKASFKLTGEQIDGAFSFEGTDYIIEVKWEKGPVKREALDVFEKKLDRKLENTLGLFISINGFCDEAVNLHSARKSSMILMDGSDLVAVLENRIELPQLLFRKRRYASMTGQIFLRFADINK